MTLGFGLAIYLVIWWIVLLAVLPFGVRNASEAQEPVKPGHDPGAPVIPDLKRKLLITSVIALAIFLIIWANEHYGWLTFAMLPGPDNIY